MNVSIVLPVHDAESFLLATLQSLELALSDGDQLIIVLDNCSDGSAYVADKWRRLAETLKKIEVVILNRNFKSVALSRNEGMRYATNQWIGFMDHDDRVNPDIYRRLISEASFSGADVVRCGLTKDYGNNWEHSFPNYPPEYYAFFGIFVWNSLFSRKLINTNCIEFRPGYGEDYEFNLEIALCLSHQSFTDFSYYKWRIHENNLHKKRSPIDFCSRVSGIYARHGDRIMAWPNLCAAFIKWIQDYTDHLYRTMPQPDVLYALRCENIDSIVAKLKGAQPYIRV